MATAITSDDTDLASHFEFGANWRRFLSLVDESRIAEAEQSLRTFFRLGDDVKPLAGRRFLDAGCGSGLFSLAAVRLGAEVTSIDLDPESIACAQELKRRFGDERSEWTITEGSALDREFLSSLGSFDVVYSWGVLHHTGAMWEAIDAVSGAVADGGVFFVAIYNDQGARSQLWHRVKKLYVALPAFLKTPYVVFVGGFYFVPKAIFACLGKLIRLICGRGPTTNRSLVERVTRSGDRGMSRWYDLVDWVGGYPFEVAKPEELLEFLRERGFQLDAMRTVGGNLGCNELVFRRGPS